MKKSKMAKHFEMYVKIYEQRRRKEINLNNTLVVHFYMIGVFQIEFPT
jgi:hypothetical protein